MSSPVTEQLKSPTDNSEGNAKALSSDKSIFNTKLLSWSGIVFALLQSACTAVIAISGLRVAIGLSALAAAAGLHEPPRGFHQDAIRIPMMGLAVLVSVINHFVVWKMR